MNKNIILIVLGIVALGAILFFFGRAPTIEIPENVTIEPNVTEEGAKPGDLVTIDFVLYLENGTVADTNNPELAEEAKLINYVKGPYRFILSQSDKVKGFDEALIGMQEGEHGEFTILPSEEEVILNVGKTKTIRRFLPVPKLQWFPASTFEALFGKPPIIGDVVFNEGLQFKYQVINVTNKTVIGKMVVKEGEEYMLENTEWPSKVVEIAEEDVLFYQSPEENQTLETPFGPARITLTKSTFTINYEPVLNKIFNKSIELSEGFTLPQKFIISDVRERDFTIKRYGVLAEKKLKLVANMINIVPDVKKIKQKKIKTVESLS